MRTANKLFVGLVSALGLSLTTAPIYAQPGTGSNGMLQGMMGGGQGGIAHGAMNGRSHMGAMMHPAAPESSHGMMMSHGPGASGFMGGPMAGSMAHDAATGSDMGLVHELLFNHADIKRSVSNLSNGIKTVTESDNPEVARAIQAHVASMEQRLKDGREFSMFSPTLPTLFKNKEKILTTVQLTKKGAVVTQSSRDPAVSAALQAHAVEVSDLAREGMTAMMRSARANMPMMQ